MITRRYIKLERELEELKKSQKIINEIFIKELESLNNKLESLENPEKQPETKPKGEEYYSNIERKKNYDKYLNVITRGKSAFKR